MAEPPLEGHGHPWAAPEPGGGSSGSSGGSGSHSRRNSNSHAPPQPDQGPAGQAQWPEEHPAGPYDGQSQFAPSQTHPHPQQLQHLQHPHFEEDPYLPRIVSFQQSIVSALRSLMTYKLIPDSGKMVVFDSRLQISDALNGLLHHDINCAPVWDSVARRYIGMLTVSDYIDILRHAYAQQDPTAMEGSRRICDWQSIKRARGTSIGRLLYLSPESSMYEAVEMLTRFRIHRICIMQSGALANTVLSILSQHAVLGYMLGVVGFAMVPELREFDLPLGVLPLGRLHEVCMVDFDTTVIRALDLLNAMQISTLPIVDAEGYLVDSYSRSDAKYLALVRHPDLNMTLRETLGAIRNTPALHLCRAQDSLWEICNRMLETGAHTLICVAEVEPAAAAAAGSAGEEARRSRRSSSAGSQPVLAPSSQPQSQPGHAHHPQQARPRFRVERLITINEILCFLIGRPGTKSYYRPQDTMNVRPGQAAMSVAAGESATGAHSAPEDGFDRLLGQEPHGLPPPQSAGQPMAATAVGDGGGIDLAPLSHAHPGAAGGHAQPYSNPVELHPQQHYQPHQQPQHHQLPSFSPPELNRRFSYFGDHQHLLPPEPSGGYVDPALAAAYYQHSMGAQQQPPYFPHSSPQQQLQPQQQYHPHHQPQQQPQYHPQYQMGPTSEEFLDDFSEDESVFR